ncbi:type I glyceraldehyde-3-phosphate dehydrogenase [Helicobacter sp. MIT 14-3879]|uniref:type I glyceraldehyde-3-phosphate dehydrogenase n=1 Tax=Helicobacter sp. MIT 14-3879 TaxID=2040649 RepID=UPI000E1EFD03|nr:type I glyceraldehyde-3-phosphate dehydrogenase [Helicobacter sp. MIT 14-3879]RDU64013.1 type I glyceraldehyde-3-phosphate dehydrogenase [Helicobacter sp. MIT 14-3879]
MFAINGTGRIGLCTARLIGERNDIELVAINSTADVDTLIHLLSYDSIHRPSVSIKKVNDNTISIGSSKNVRVLSDRNIDNLDFGNAKCVIECTGKFNSFDKSKAHLKGNIKKVVISAPADNVPMYIYGINHKSYRGEAIVSNASCTTNCLAPLIQVLHNNFGVESGLMTTIHSYTNDQNVLDVKHKDLRRARAAALNMIPTSTGAAKAIGKIFPELDGKLNGLAIRVPTPNVSLVDLSVRLKKKVSVESINNAFLNAEKANPNLIKNDLNKLVSSDFIGCKISSIFIPDKTIVIDDYNAKILAWYDNELGYSSRLIDLSVYVSND